MVSRDLFYYVWFFSAEPKLVEYQARRDFRDNVGEAFYFPVEDSEVRCKIRQAILRKQRP